MGNKSSTSESTEAASAERGPMSAFRRASFLSPSIIKASQSQKSGSQAIQWINVGTGQSFTSPQRHLVQNLATTCDQRKRCGKVASAFQPRVAAAGRRQNQVHAFPCAPPHPVNDALLRTSTCQRRLTVAGFACSPRLLLRTSSSELQSLTKYHSIGTIPTACNE